MYNFIQKKITEQENLVVPNIMKLGLYAFIQNLIFVCLFMRSYLYLNK